VICAPEAIPVPCSLPGWRGSRDLVAQSRSSTLRNSRPFPASAEKSLAQRLQPIRTRGLGFLHFFVKIASIRSRISRVDQDFGFAAAAGVSGGCTSDGSPIDFERARAVNLHDGLTLLIA